MPTKLSVNINKVATLRNARGGNLPDVIKFAKDCEMYGAEGITVHPRPDERHIRFADVYELKKVVSTELNIEGNPNEKFIQLIEAVKPQQTTLVPDAEHVITSSEGWDIVTHFDYLTQLINRLKQTDTRVSIFINPDIKQVEAAQKVGADRIEIYTGDFAHHYSATNNNSELIKPYADCAVKAAELGLGVNAGHDLSLENLEYFKQQVNPLHEVSIGHAIISDALYFGIQNTIAMYKRLLK
jgi:pyridoxine 5-phosphate synthase